MARMLRASSLLLAGIILGCTFQAKADRDTTGRTGRMLGEDLSKVTQAQKTAVRATIRIVGPDVDPFNSVKQAALTSAVQSSMTTVEADNINILTVTPVYSTSSSQSATTTGDDDSSSDDDTSGDSDDTSAAASTSSSTSSDDEEDGVSSTGLTNGVDNSRRRHLLGQATKVLMRRRLLDEDASQTATLLSAEAYALGNQVDVLYELDSDNSTATSAVIAELKLAVKNTTNSKIPAALQAQGYAEWGVTLESAYTSIPMPGNFTFPCFSKFGVFCLDGTGLSSSAVKGIIAACVIGFVLLIALLWLAFDLVHSPRKVVVVKPEDSAAAGTDKSAIAAGMTAGGAGGAPGTATKEAIGPAAPPVAPVQTPGGRFGFIDRWFQPPPSPFGSTVRVPILQQNADAQGIRPYTPLSAQAQGRTGFTAPGQGVPPTANTPTYTPPPVQAESSATTIETSAPSNGIRAIPGLGSEAAPTPPSLARNSARYDGPAGIKPAGPRSNMK